LAGRLRGGDRQVTRRGPNSGRGARSWVQGRPKLNDIRYPFVGMGGAVAIQTPTEIRLNGVTHPVRLRDRVLGERDGLFVERTRVPRPPGDRHAVLVEVQPS